MHLLNKEIVGIILESDANLEYSYQKLKLLTAILNVFVKISRIIAYVGSFILLFTIRGCLMGPGSFTGRETFDSTLFFLACAITYLFIWFASEKFATAYNRNMKVAEKYFIFLCQLENEEYSESQKMLFYILQETNDSKNLFLISASCVAILILIDFFKQSFSKEILDQQLKKLSALEAFSMKLGLVYWGKGRIYLELGEERLAQEYFKKYETDFPKENEIITKPENKPATNTEHK